MFIVKWNTNRSTKRSSDKGAARLLASSGSVGEFTAKEAGREVVGVSDEKLYAELPPREECPTCCVTLPCDDDETRYMSCCGKIICCGCRYCLPREHCPSCNTVVPQSDEECNRRILERIEIYNDPVAMYILGQCYAEGTDAFPVDYEEAVGLFQRASELGSAQAHFNLGLAYKHGRVILADNEKSNHHYRMAAVKGSMTARFNLGLMEGRSGNHDCGMRHLMIAAKCGHATSMEAVRQGFVAGYVTKRDFKKTLRAHKASRDEAKSDQRDKAKAIIAQSFYGRLSGCSFEEKKCSN